MAVRSWVVDAGAADVGTTYLKLVVEGNTRSTVLLEGIRAVVTTRAEPLDATYVASPSAGDVTVHAVGIDLDEPEPIARAILRDERYAVEVSPAFGEPYFGDYAASISRGEMHVYAIQARTAHAYCEWQLQLDLVMRGQRMTMRIDDDDQPFRTTARVPEYQRRYEWGWFMGPDARFVQPHEAGDGGIW